ncbi:ribosome maturation factor [Niabella ginsenosidivorans]|uniref:Ribosome maturation factor RimP n=1 Tax=Niabella ginsenosidivorans TaxID=1176587 RepID=A0A1A9HW38_9BACT|nr:ribosome assembly cofactor RimP [Niabella ginsenosidivorans]ANH79596.1 ribosome maturation factor [Niabella ginsenosidivorans]
MNKEEIIEQIQEKVVALLTQNPSHFLVDIRIKPTNNFKIFIDGDEGVGIDDLVKYNRALYKQMEEEGFFPDGDFSLEVSSPGLDEPLKLYRQYVKNIGRDVEVITLDGKKVEGRLLSVDDKGLVVEETKGKGRKMEKTEHSILFETIKTTKIQIKF